MFSLDHYEFIVQYWCRTDKRWYNHLTTESREAAQSEVAYMLDEGWHTKDEIRVVERKLTG